MQEKQIQLERLLRHKPQILVVDDNQDFAENIAEVVQDQGYISEVALTGKQALDRFVQKPFEVAIIDLQLPDMPGTRLIARLKEIHPDCVCIVFTGNATLGNAVDALNHGAFAYLIKGGEVDEFRAVLSKALEAYGTSVELKQIRGINQAIMENFPGRMMILDSEGRIVLTNNYALPWIPSAHIDGSKGAGRRVEDMFSRSHAWSAAVLDHFQRCRDSAEPTMMPRLKVSGPGGDESYFNVHFIPLFHSLARHLVLVEEITKLVELESEMAKSARLAAMGELTAMIAHEVRNPLSGISGAVQILRKKIPRDNPDWEICDQVISQVDRLNKTIEDLLVLARPMAPKLAETSLVDLIEATASFLKEDLNFKKIEIRTSFQDDDRCLIDPFLFRQALTNVMINAAQAMGGEGTITVISSSDPDRIQLKVQDTGPGFPENPSRLFEPFYTTKPAGTGLGLPITAKILEVHGGSISLRNSARGGAEVVLTLPKRPNAP